MRCCEVVAQVNAWVDAIHLLNRTILSDVYLSMTTLPSDPNYDQVQYDVRKLQRYEFCLQFLLHHHLISKYSSQQIRLDNIQHLPHTLLY